MKRSELGYVLDCIKSEHYIKSYIEAKVLRKDSRDYYQAIAFISGICSMLILDNLIDGNQIHELYDATNEYLETKSSKRLDRLFDEMKKGGRE